MSAGNPRRDLRLRLEGCSVGEDSEDEQIHPRPVEAFVITVKATNTHRHYLSQLLCFAITCYVYIAGHSHARGCRAL